MWASGDQAGLDAHLWTLTQWDMNEGQSVLQFTTDLFFKGDILSLDKNTRSRSKN